MFSWVKAYFSVSSSVVSDDDGGGSRSGEGGNRVEEEDEEEEEETPFSLDLPLPGDSSLPSESVGEKIFLDVTPDPMGGRKPERVVDDPDDSGYESIDSHIHKNTKSSSSRADARGPGQSGRGNSRFKFSDYSNPGLSGRDQSQFKFSDEARKFEMGAAISSLHSEEIYNKRKNLPKIEYRKITNLSMTNFTEYLEGIGRVGYSRDWPESLYQPTRDFLAAHSWSQDSTSTDEIWKSARKESYLVLCNTIPSNLKYLIRKVDIGDTIGIWIALYARFRHVTHHTIKLLKTEWNTLSMQTTGLKLDEFCSHVIKKSKHLQSMGVSVSEKEEVITLLNGLSSQFDWLTNTCRIQERAGLMPSFDELSSLALDYAADKGLMAESKTALVKKSTGTLMVVEGGRKMYCFAYASEKGCQRGSSCRFLHEKDPKDSKINIVSERKDTKKKVKSKVECFHCKKIGHKQEDCRSLKKEQAEEKKGPPPLPMFLSC